VLVPSSLQVIFRVARCSERNVHWVLVQKGKVGFEHATTTIRTTEPHEIPLQRKFSRPFVISASVPTPAHMESDMRGDAEAMKTTTERVRQKWCALEPYAEALRPLLCRARVEKD
jgi:hypothetical protein